MSNVTFRMARGLMGLVVFLGLALSGVAAGPDIPRFRIVAYEPKPGDSISALADPAGEYCLWPNVAAAWAAAGYVGGVVWTPGTTEPPVGQRLLGQYRTGAWYKTYEYEGGGSWIAIDPSGYRRPNQLPPLFWMPVYEPGTEPPGPLTVVSILPEQVGPTNASELVFRVTFSEDVTGFEGSDVVIVPSGVAYSSVAVTGGPRVYDVAVLGITGDGSFRLYVDTASDIRGAGGGALTPGAMTVTAQMGDVKDVPLWLYHVMKGLMTSVSWQTIMDAGDMVETGIPPKGEPE